MNPEELGENYIKSKEDYERMAEALEVGLYEKALYYNNRLYEKVFQRYLINMCLKRSWYKKNIERKDIKELERLINRDLDLLESLIKDSINICLRNV